MKANFTWKPRGEEMTQCPVCNALDHPVYKYKGRDLIVCPQAPIDQIICFSPKRAELRKIQTVRIVNIGNEEQFKIAEEYFGE
jgi:hypothetical protein